MTKRDIYINRIILFSINREFSLKKVFVPWDGMGYSKKFSSHGMGRCSKFFVPSHPMGQNFLKNVPWDGMGWDGMGLSHPTRSPDSNPVAIK